jgi:hypothetical protein
MDELKNIFLNLKEAERFQRIEKTHPIAWYVGLDECNNYALFAITMTQPKKVNSTEMIKVFIGQRQDGKYGITFSLNEKSNLDLFIHFCSDMVSFTKRASKQETAADYICSRYLQWLKAFKKNGAHLLSNEEIKGLIGELLFLETKMMPLYGPEKALESWTGIDATDQDFSCDNTWYEVKSTSSGSPSVTIHSVEQLDTRQTGHLVVITLDKTSDADSSKITLNNMIERVIKLIPEKVSQDKLSDRLFDFGYYKDESYDHIGFKFNGMAMYRVDEEFPCLRKNQLPTSVQNVKYGLTLAAIENFREE